MDLDDDEMIAVREKRDLNKMIEECEKAEHAVTFYGSDKKIAEEALKCYRTIQKDKKIIKDALNCYKAVQEQIAILRKQVDLCVEPHYWVKEKYHLEKLEKLLKGEATGL